MEGLRDASISRLHYVASGNFFQVETLGASKAIHVELDGADQALKQVRMQLEWATMGDVLVALASILGSMLAFYGVILQIRNEKRLKLAEMEAANSSVGTAPRRKTRKKG